MILVKEGVRFRKLLGEIYSIFSILDLVFGNHGVDCVITSANDSSHSSGSLHYSDLALDLRSWVIPSSGEKHILVDEVRQALGLDYDVLLEDEDGLNEHIHLEYDPS
jgi:hypothetical protein